MYPKLEGGEVIIAAVHRALVEVFTLKQAGLPLVLDYHAGDSYLDDADDYLQRLAKEARFEVDATGEGRLLLEHETLEQAILNSITPKEVQKEDEDELEAEDAGQLDTYPPEVERQKFEIESPTEPENHEDAFTDKDGNPTNSQDFVQSLLPVDQNWRNVSLQDSGIKFAVCYGRYLFCRPLTIPGPQASHAVDRHTHPRPSHCKYHECKVTTRSSNQETQT